MFEITIRSDIKESNELNRLAGLAIALREEVIKRDIILLEHREGRLVVTSKFPLDADLRDKVKTLAKDLLRFKTRVIFNHLRGMR